MKLPVKTLAEAKLVLYRQRPALDERDPSQKAFYVPRPLDTYADFIDEATAAFKSGSPFRWFFTGHTGAGKSTELNRLTASPELDEHYLPYIYRVLDNLDVNDLQFTDLLLGLAQSIMELARAHKVKIPKTLDTRIADWDKEIEIEREFTGSAAAKAGLEFNLWFAKASTEVQAGGEKKRIIREKMRESITSFIALVDDLAHKVETVRKKKLLIVFDQLDHVPQGPASASPPSP